MTKTIPEGTTTFQGYEIPRYSKSKPLIQYTNDRAKESGFYKFYKSTLEICKNCHMPAILHPDYQKCPQYEIIINTK